MHWGRIIFIIYSYFKYNSSFYKNQAFFSYKNRTFFKGFVLFLDEIKNVLTLKQGFGEENINHFEAWVMSKKLRITAGGGGGGLDKLQNKNLS